LRRAGELGEWETLVKKTTKAEMTEICNMEEDEFDEDFYDVEVSIIKKDYEFGHESYGGEGPDKIILPADEECCKEHLEMWTRRAEAVCRVLNTL
jgi:hypothetical protein